MKYAILCILIVIQIPVYIEAKSSYNELHDLYYKNSKENSEQNNQRRRQANKRLATFNEGEIANENLDARSSIVSKEKTKRKDDDSYFNNFANNEDIEDERDSKDMEEEILRNNENPYLRDEISPSDDRSPNHSKTSSIAQMAAEEAKSARAAQNMAGARASYFIKKQLAEKALQAAKSAKLALESKKGFIQELQREMKETMFNVKKNEIDVKNERMTFDVTEDVFRQNKLLSQAYQTSAKNLEQIQSVLSKLKANLEGKIQDYTQYQEKLKVIKKKLKEALDEYAETKIATQQANAAAKSAFENAKVQKRMRRKDAINKR